VGRRRVRVKARRLARRTRAPAATCCVKYWWFQDIGVSQGRARRRMPRAEVRISR
jgi:hypothetical protein